MAICPVCRAEGELAKECQQCHKHFVEEADLRKSHNDELLGDIIGGQYVPLALIGEGGMGKIYKAKSKYIGKTVALKVLKSEYMEDETLKDRFFREAEVVSALDHPNIVKLYGCAPDEQHNTIFMAMELLAGRTLFDILAKSVPSLNDMIALFIEISAALGEAHKNGIFHRDLKPENVFVVKDEDGNDHAKVLDFGFARLQGASKKLTMAGVAFGTPHYMSPEQAMGLDDITAACDVYALGVMLFQAISGKVPFDRELPMDVMRDQCFTKTPTCVPRPDYIVTKRLINCIYKCMEKKPNDRFANGNELCDELVAIQDELKSAKGELVKDTLVTEPVKPPSKNPLSGVSSNVLILGGVLVFLVLVVIILILWVI